MSFYEIESGFSTMLQGVDRRKADREAHDRLKAKLLELRKCGMDVEMPVELTELPEDIGGVLGDASRSRQRLA